MTAVQKTKHMFKRTKKRIRSASRLSKTNLSLFAVIFAGLGTYIIINSLAATTLGSALPAQLPESSGTKITGNSTTALSTQIAALQPDNTLCLPGGVIYGQGSTSDATISVSGTAANPITIETCAGSTTKAEIAQRIHVYGSYIRLRNIKVTRNVLDTDKRDKSVPAQPNGVPGGGNVNIWFEGASSHVTLEKSEISGSGMTGVFGGGSFNQILANYIHDNGTTSDDHGIYYAGSDSLIANNIVYNNYDFGIQIAYSKAINNKIANNTTVHNGYKNTLVKGSGTVTFSGATSNIFVNNISYDNSKYGYETYDSAIDNNTLSHNDSYLNAQGDTSGAFASNTSLFTFNPTFVSSTDFHLQSTSPLVDPTKNATGDPAYTPPTDFAGTTRTTAILGAYAYEVGTSLSPVVVSDQIVPYDAASPWNSPIGSAATDSNSAAFINNIKNNGMQLTSDPTQYSPIIIPVNNSTPKVPIMLLEGNYGWGNGYIYDNGDNIADKTSTPGNLYGTPQTISNVPIPANMSVSQIPVNDDAQVVFWNTDTGEEWAFWQFRPTAQNTEAYPSGSSDVNSLDPNTSSSNYTTNNAAKWAGTNLTKYHTKTNSSGNRYFGRLCGQANETSACAAPSTMGVGGRGAGTPYFAGLIRPWEVASGSVNHALSFAYNYPCGQFRYPAAKSDGSASCASTTIGGQPAMAPPEGTRLQLDPTLTDAQLAVAPYNLTTPAQRTVAHAMQIYGLYIIDNSGRPKLNLEYSSNPNWNSATPLNQNSFSGIPWTAFRVVVPPCDPTATSCSTTPPTDAPPTVSMAAPAASTVLRGTVTVSANAADDNSVSSVQFKLDGVNLGSADTTSPYSVSWNTTTASAGSHTLTAVATDSTNQTATSSGVTVTVDNTAPTTSLTTQPTSPTNSQSASFSFTASETSTYQCSLDGAAYAGCTSPKAYIGLAGGSHSFNVYATDTTGNPDATPASYTWSIDTTAPVTVISSTPPSSTSSTSASLSFAANETGSMLQCKLDAAAYSACTSPKSYTALAVGNHSFTVKATDTAGNAEITPPTYAWTVVAIDSTAPTISLTAPVNNATVSGASVNIATNASDNIGVAGVKFYLDPATTNGQIGAEDVTSPYSVTWDTSSIANGTHALTAIARDAAGNTTTATYITVTVNNTVTSPPDTTPPSTPANLFATPASSTGIGLSWNASNDSGTGATGVAGYRVYRSTTSGGTYALVNTVSSGTTYADNGLSVNTTYYYKVSAVDNAAAPNESPKAGPASATTNDLTPTVTLTANPTSVNSGASSNLTWTTTRATGCNASGAWSGAKGTSGTNVSTGNLTTGSVFNLACLGSGGSASTSATVAVNTPTPNPTPTPTKKPGDCNGNGKVDIYDLSILLSHWGKSYTESDFKTDGVVNIYDLSILLSNYGK
jgi:hypothetical protein